MLMRSRRSASGKRAIAASGRNADDEGVGSCRREPLRTFAPPACPLSRPRLLPWQRSYMAVAAESPTTPAFERWIPLARQVVRQSLRLGWKDVFEIYTYVPTIPLAEALALEARRAGSDTHITLMTDYLWFTSMRELSTRWLRLASPVEYAIHRAITADVYLGGPADARRMRDIPPEKFDANAMGNQ